MRVDERLHQRLGLHRGDVLRGEVRRELHRHGSERGRDGRRLRRGVLPVHVHDGRIVHRRSGLRPGRRLRSDDEAMLFSHAGLHDVRVHDRQLPPADLLRSMHGLEQQCVEFLVDFQQLLLLLGSRIEQLFDGFRDPDGWRVGGR